MKAIDFVVRTGMDAVERGQVSASETVTKIGVSAGAELSLNLRQMDLQSFTRVGPNLEIVLVDGRVILVENYFAHPADAPRLFVSADGYLNEVSVVEGGDGRLYAQFGPTEQWGKWSPTEDLIFLGDAPVVAADPVRDNEVSMLAAGLLGASGLGLLGAGAAVAGAGAILGGGGGGGNGGGAPEVIIPTVNEKDPIVIGGDSDPSIIISGTGAPGSEVDVTIGDQTVSTEVDEDGNWQVEFEGDTFPEDGDHDVDVSVVDPDGNEHDLSGPDVFIDTTPPDLTFTQGTISVGHVTNAEDHSDGVELGGTGEPGASLEITIDGHTINSSVGADGTWFVVIDQSVLPGGEYDMDVVVVATDAYGNSATYTDAVRIDTIPNPITIDADTFEGDGVMNAVEHADGITVTGTSLPGQVVTVTLAGVSQDVTVSSGGTWTTTFPTETLAGGEYDVQITASSTDAAGNFNEITETVRVDTVTHVALSDAPVAGDGIINAVERQNGVMFSGTTEPGASVMVSFGSGSRPAAVDAAGNWTVTFVAAEIPQGETSAMVTAVATDAAGNTASTSGQVQIDTVVTNFAFTGTIGGADGVVNAAEAAEGINVTGTVEPGSTVSVIMGGVTYSASVAANGSWSAHIPASAIAHGEYTANLTAVATDAAGNVAEINRDVVIDTDPGLLTISQAPIAGDNVVNYDEAQQGVVIHGTSDPGALIHVTMGDVTLTTITDATGRWERLFTTAQLPAAEQMDVPITARKTDAAGNTAEVSRTVGYDRIVENLSVRAEEVGGDGTINAAERAAGVTVTGTVEPGSSVIVNLGTASRSAQVDAAGNWTAFFTATQLPQGEDVLPLVVNATDRHGNNASTSATVNLDTLVNQLTQTGDPTGGDGVINIAEAAAGVTLSGMVEAGSTLIVTTGGVSYEASVGPNGAWSLYLPSEALPSQGTRLDVTISATDAAGNTDSISQSFDMDLIQPVAPDVDSYTRNTSGYSAISVALGDDSVQVFEIRDGQVIGQVGGEGIPIAPLGIETFAFAPVVSDGSHLVVQATAIPRARSWRSATGRARSTPLICPARRWGSSISNGSTWNMPMTAS